MLLYRDQKYFHMKSVATPLNPGMQTIAEYIEFKITVTLLFIDPIHIVHINPT